MRKARRKESGVALRSCSGMISLPGTQAACGAHSAGTARSLVPVMPPSPARIQAAVGERFADMLLADRVGAGHVGYRAGNPQRPVEGAR